MDVSNYASEFGEVELMAWQLQHDVGRVIVQAVDPARPYPPSATRQQIEACAAVGMPTDVYLYLWTQSDVRADMLAKLALLNGLEQHVGRLWLDVEDTADATVVARMVNIRVALGVLDDWSAAHQKLWPGLYTGAWWWRAYLADTSLFKERSLWVSQYDGIEDPAVFNAFGGWTSCAIKQYRGSSALAGVSGVDLNILNEGAL